MFTKLHSRMISIMRYLLLLLVVSPVVRSFVAYNILGVFPHPGKSHMDVFTPLMKGLALKGHNVTVISPFPLQSSIPNYKDVSLKENNKILINTIHMDEIVSSRYRKYTTILFLSYHANSTCENGLSSEAFQSFMKTKEKFDVIITEFFNTDCFMCLAHKFKAPIIGVSSSTPMSWTSDRLANPRHTAYIPNNLMDFSDHMSFLERAENTVVTILHNFYYEYVMFRQDEQIARKHFGRKSATLRAFVMNCSLMLVNTHFSLSRPRPLVPNVVEVGGIHIGQPQLLPKCVQHTRIFAHPGKSHADVFVRLSQKGHNVTVLTHFPLLKLIPNYKDISLRGNSQVLVEIVDTEQIDAANRFDKY